MIRVMVKGDYGGGDEARLDADRLLQRAQAVHRRVRRLAGGRAVELYQRTSSLVRVARAGGGTSLDRICGVEEGTAVRVASREGGYTFGAASGCDPVAAEEAMTRALVGNPVDRGDTRPAWRSGPPASLLDRRRGTLAGEDELARWLRLAVARVERAASAPRVRVGPAWVEAGLTVESLVADGGLAASRERSRCWSMARLIVGVDGRGRERVRAVAARTLDGLPPGGWGGPEERPLADPAGRLHLRGPVLLEPPAAATLVEGLARTVHGPGTARNTRVGSGWRLKDDPEHPEGLSGGTFDDAGFDTRQTALADGKSVRAVLAGPGHFRRPSFRDPPRPRFSTLVVEPGNASPPDRGAVVPELRIHPLGPDLWVLEMEGHLVDGGEPVEAFREWFVRARPLELVEAVADRVGPSRFHPNGVATPSLLLSLRGQQP